MSRLTEYHCGIAVIKDKNKHFEAMQKLARYEDLEDHNLLVTLPCNVGDIVHIILFKPASERYFAEKAEVKEINIGKYSLRRDMQIKVEPVSRRGSTYKYYLSEWGVNIFETQAEAEVKVENLNKGE